MSSTGLNELLNKIIRGKISHIGSGSHRHGLSSILLLWFPGEMRATTPFLLSGKLPISKKLTHSQIFME